MELAVFGKTDVGCRREKNEDSYLINTKNNLYVVADGMGGHLGGEFASRLAVATIDEVIEEVTQDPDATLQSSDDVKQGDYKSYLRYAISVASMRIYERAANEPNLHGMGTTVVGALFRDGKIFLANVGDSRCYLIRGGKIRQLTEDHSLVGEQLRAGVITQAEVKNHKYKNIITRSVGFQEAVDIDIITRTIKKDDKFLLCSDGLTNMVPNDEILEIVDNYEPREACEKLIEVANNNGGDDNITAVISQVLSVGDSVVADELTEGI